MDTLALLDATLSAFDSRVPDAIPARCVVTRYRGSSCRLCVDVCPTGAITPAPWLRVDPDLCLGCGACAAACRTGALDLGQAKVAVLNAFSELAEAGETAPCIACARATPDEATFAPDDDVCDSGEVTTTPDLVIDCLASLSAGDFIGLDRQGCASLVLLSGDCEGCASGKAMVQSVSAEETASRVLGALGHDLAIRRIPTETRTLPQRPREAALSRRDLFGLLVGRGRRAAADATAPKKPTIDELHAWSSPPAAHRRLVSDVAALAEGAGEVVTLPCPLPLATVVIGTGCNGCGLCARYCPHAAITTVDGLAVVEAGLCTACGLCAEVCPPGAVELGPAVVARGARGLADPET